MLLPMKEQNGEAAQPRRLCKTGLKYRNCCALTWHPPPETKYLRILSKLRSVPSLFRWYLACRGPSFPSLVRNIRASKASVCSTKPGGLSLPRFHLNASRYCAARVPSSQSIMCCLASSNAFFPRQLISTAESGAHQTVTPPAQRIRPPLARQTPPAQRALLSPHAHIFHQPTW